MAANPDDLAAYVGSKGSFDVLFECSGTKRAIRDALATLRPRGTVVQLGLVGSEVAFPLNLLVAKELTLFDSFASTKNLRSPPSSSGSGASTSWPF